MSELATDSQNNSDIVGAIMPSVEVKQLRCGEVSVVNLGKEHGVGSIVSA